MCGASCLKYSWEVQLVSWGHKGMGYEEECMRFTMGVTNLIPVIVKNSGDNVQKGMYPINA